MSDFREFYGDDLARLKKQLRYVLRAAHGGELRRMDRIRFEGGKAIATDGHRIHIVHDIGLDGTIDVPARLVEDVIKWVGDRYTEIKIADEKLVVVGGVFQLDIHGNTGPWVPWKQLIRGGHIATVKARDLAAAVKSATFRDADNDVVKLSARGDKFFAAYVEVEGRAVDSWTGTHFQSRFVLDALPSGGNVAIYGDDDEYAALQIETLDEEGKTTHTAVIMPIRTSEQIRAKSSAAKKGAA